MVSFKTVLTATVLAAGASAVPTGTSYGNSYGGGNSNGGSGGYGGGSGGSGGGSGGGQPQQLIKFSGLAARSASPIHYSSMNAFGLGLWLQGTTATYCPFTGSQKSLCPKGTETVLGFSGGYLSMDTLVPGGQRVYIGPDGALSYTQAHSASIPQGSTIDGFTLTDTGRGYSTLSPKSGGFIACPKEGGQSPQGPWRIYVDLGTGTYAPSSGNKNDCLGFTMLAPTQQGNNVPTAAWQYT